MKWLEDVLGYERREDHRDADGNVVHAELVLRGAIVMLSSAEVGREPFRSLPAGVRLVYCALDEVDSLYERVRDPEGNLWAFGTYRRRAYEG